MRQLRIVTTSAVVALLTALSGCASGISMPDIDISEIKLPTVTVRETVTALPSFGPGAADSDGANVATSQGSTSADPTGPFITALGPPDFNDVDSAPLPSAPLDKSMTNPSTVILARTTITVTQTVGAAPMTDATTATVPSKQPAATAPGSTAPGVTTANSTSPDPAGPVS